MIRRNRSGQRGHVMVESALTLVAFAAVLICTFDFGQVLFLHQSIIERMRAALRYGVTRDYDPTAIQNMVLYGSPTQPLNGTPSFSLSPSNVSVARSNADTLEDRITVTVSQYSYEFLSPFIAGRRTGGPLIAVMPYEGVQ